MKLKTRILKSALLFEVKCLGKIVMYEGVYAVAVVVGFHLEVRRHLLVVVVVVVLPFVVVERLELQPRGEMTAAAAAAAAAATALGVE